MTARCPPRRLGCGSRSPSAPDCGGRADRAAGVGPAHAVGHGDGDEGGHGGQRGVPSRGVAGSWSSPTRRTSARGASNSTRISCSRSRTTSPGTGLHPRTCCSGRHIPRAGRIASTPSVGGGPRSDRAERSRAALRPRAYVGPRAAGRCRCQYCRAALAAYRAVRREAGYTTSASAGPTPEPTSHS